MKSWSVAIPNKAKMELFFNYAVLRITVLKVCFCELFHCFFGGQVQTSVLKDHAVQIVIIILCSVFRKKIWTLYISS